MKDEDRKMKMHAQEDLEIEDFSYIGRGADT